MDSEEATQMNIGGPLKRQKTDRSFFKCDTCRGWKCKCLPVIRDFDKGERCESCVKRGLPCGPHRRFQPGADNTPMVHTAPSHLPSSINTFTFQPIFPQPVNRAPPNIQDVIGNINPGGTAVGNGTTATIRSATTTEPSLHLSSASVLKENVPSGLRSAPEGSVNSENAVKAGFDALTGLCDLVSELRNRQHAASFTTPSFTAVRHILIKMYFDSAIVYVCKRLLQAFRDTFYNLGNYNGSMQELYWRRLLEYAQNIPTLISQSDEHEYKNFTAELWKHKILEKLISVCDNANRVADADRFCRILMEQPNFDSSAYSPSQRSRFQDCFRRRSELMKAQFAGFHLPREYRPMPDATNDQFPPAHLAVRDDQLWAVDGLLQPATTDPELQVEYSHDVIGRSVVQAIIEKGSAAGLDELKRLQQQDPDCVNGKDALGMTSTGIAVVGGNLEHLNWSILQTDQMNERDKAGRSLLRIACDARQSLSAQRLLEEGVDPDDYCLDQGTTLDAARESNQQELADLLEQKIKEARALQEEMSFTYSSTLFDSYDFDS